MLRTEQRRLDWLGYTIREFRLPQNAIPEDSQVYRCIQGDMLDYIAYCFYGAHWPWYVIADTNDIMDPFFACRGGERLIVPLR